MEVEKRRTEEQGATRRYAGYPSSEPTSMVGRPRTGRVSSANWTGIRVAIHDLVSQKPTKQPLASSPSFSWRHHPPDSEHPQTTHHMSLEKFPRGDWTELLTRSEDVWPLASNTHAPNWNKWEQKSKLQRINCCGETKSAELQLHVENVGPWVSYLFPPYNKTLDC